jgi:threonine synthase
MQFTLNDLAVAHRLVTAYMPPTPQHAWPLLAERVGAQVWVKHENHTPTGSFKVRGALTFIDWLKHTYPDARGICTATRGNHGQGQAWAATAAGLTAKVYVPRGNSVEKNAAMRAFGAELVEFGEDFDSAREEAYRVAARRGCSSCRRSTGSWCAGVATYGYELFQAVPDLDAVYVPIGCGSGICGTIAARDALGREGRDHRRGQRERAHRETVGGGGAARWKPRAAAPSPTAWPCGCRCPRRWRSIPGCEPRGSWRSPTRRSPRRSASTIPTPTTSPKGRAPRRWPR